MAGLTADRRFCVTADRSELVEETDPRAAFLAYAAGNAIQPADVERYGLTEKDGRVVLPGAKAAPAPANKMVEAPADKAVEPDEPDDEAEADDEWTLSMTPQEYLDRYGEDAKNSALALRLIGE